MGHTSSAMGSSVASPSMQTQHPYGSIAQSKGGMMASQNSLSVSKAYTSVEALHSLQQIEDFETKQNLDKPNKYPQINLKAHLALDKKK